MPLIQPVTLLHIDLRPLRNPLMMLAPALYRMLPALPKNPTMEPGSPRNQPTTPFHAFLAPFAAELKMLTMVEPRPEKKPMMPCTQEPRKPVKLDQTALPVLVQAKK